MNHTRKALLGCSAALLVLGFSSASFAQQRRFDIPSQEATSAIPAFALQAGVRISAPVSQLKGVKTPAIRGDLDARAALRQLLAGTGLEIASDDGSVIMLRKARTEAPTDAGPSAAVESEVLGEIIVTAGKRAEKISNVASSMTAATGEFLSAVGAKGLQDYLAYVPGLSLQSYGAAGRTQVTLRGITSGGNQVPSAVATYVNEAPFGSSSSFVGAGQTSLDLDPSDLERVEILRGPQGTLYGASSLGGLVKYVTKRPDLEILSAKAQQEVVSAKGGDVGYSLRGTVNAPISAGTAAIRASLFYRNDPGYVDDPLRGRSDINGNEGIGGSAALLVKPADNLSLRANLLVQRYKSDGFSAEKVNPVTLQPIYGDRNVGLQIDEKNVSKNYLLAAGADYDFGPAVLSMDSSFSRLIAGEWRDYTAYFRDAFALPAANSNLAYAGMRLNKATEEIRLASSSNQKLEWITGIFYTYESGRAHQKYTGYLPDGDVASGTNGYIYENFINSSYTEYAAYGNATYYFRPNLDATLGYRLSHNEQSIIRNRAGLSGNPTSPFTFRSVGEQPSSDTNSTYLASLRWRPDTATLLYARVASGYRPGGPRDLAPGVTVPAGFVYSFEPDTVWNYEVGLKRQWWQGRLSTDLAIYLMDWSGIQAQQRIGAFSVTGNAGDAEAKGVEFSATLRPVRGLSVTATLAHTRATLDQASTDFRAVAGDRLPNVPEWNMGLAADYAFPVGDGWRGYVGGSYQYVSDRPSDFSLSTIRIDLPSYETVDLRAGLEYGRYSVGLFVKNLLNEKAYLGVSQYVSPAYGAALAVNAPRMIGLRLNQEF